MDPVATWTVDIIDVERRLCGTSRPWHGGPHPRSWQARAETHKHFVDPRLVSVQSERVLLVVPFFEYLLIHARTLTEHACGWLKPLVICSVQTGWRCPNETGRCCIPPNPTSQRSSFALSTRAPNTWNASTAVFASQVARKRIMQRRQRKETGKEDRNKGMRGTRKRESYLFTSRKYRI